MAENDKEVAAVKVLVNESKPIWMKWEAWASLTMFAISTGVSQLHDFTPYKDVGMWFVNLLGQLVVLFGNPLARKNGNGS